MDWHLRKRIVQNWWPILLPLPLFCLPPYTSQGYPILEVGRVNAFILTHTIKSSFQSFYPVFKIIPLILVSSIFVFGNKTRRLFCLYAAISYILFALFQSISITEEYGLGICSAHLALSSLVALFWFSEVKSNRNDFNPKKRPLLSYWTFVLALFAFWGPIHPLTGRPDFNPSYILTSGAGLAFCMMTPVYLALLIHYYPRVNLPILMVTGVIGLLYSLGNMSLAFILQSNYTWWVGVLHIPLLILSGYGLVTSVKSSQFLSHSHFLLSHF